MSFDAATVFYDNAAPLLDAATVFYDSTTLPQDAATVFYDYNLPFGDPGKRHVWDGTRWNRIPEYAWNGTTWVIIV
jgi:hypothetical protein